MLKKDPKEEDHWHASRGAGDDPARERCDGGRWGGRYRCRPAWRLGGPSSSRATRSVKGPGDRRCRSHSEVRPPARPRNRQAVRECGFEVWPYTLADKIAESEMLAGIERSIWPIRMARVCPIPTIPMKAARVSWIRSESQDKKCGLTIPAPANRTIKSTIGKATCRTKPAPTPAQAFTGNIQEHVPWRFSAEKFSPTLAALNLEDPRRPEQGTGPILESGIARERKSPRPAAR